MRNQNELGLSYRINRVKKTKKVPAKCPRSVAKFELDDAQLKWLLLTNPVAALGMVAAA